MDNPRVWKFTVPGRPVGNKSTRFFNPKRGDGSPVMKHGQPVMVPTKDKDSRNFHALVVICAQEANLPLLDYAIVDIAICLPCRLKRYKTKPDEWLEPRVRPDTDNVKKTCRDALQNIAYRNDKDVMDCRSYYRFLPPDHQSYTEITIRETHWRKHIYEPGRGA